MTRHLGIDLGGTNVKAVVLEAADGAQPRIVAADQASTRAAEGPEAVLARLAAVGAAAMEAHGPIDTVGVGLPGLFDPRRGVVLLFPNLPGEWRERAVAGPMSQALGRPVALVNDVRAFTLAETRLGAARGARTVVCLALGTGVGGGIMVAGRLHLGMDGTAGEIGHQTVIPDGPRCGCGNRGCVEAVASGRHLAELAGTPTPEAAFAAARAGDPRALAAVERVAGWLGIAIANAVVLLSPDRVVVGGGLAAAGDLLLDPIRAEVLRRVTLVPAERISIVPGELGPNAGAVGAALRGMEAAMTPDEPVRARSAAPAAEDGR